MNFGLTGSRVPEGLVFLPARRLFLFACGVGLSLI
jgi:hypothetical protein